jgi:hypothetical protein
MPCLRRATREASTEDLGCGDEFDKVCAGRNREPKQARKINHRVWYTIREHFIFLQLIFLKLEIAGAAMFFFATDFGADIILRNRGKVEITASGSLL